MNLSPLARRGLRRLLAGAALPLAGLPAFAQELSWSTYGTLGFARSDAAYTYQTHIDRGGTLSRDSVLGVQGDVRFGPQWSATAQLKLAPSAKHDSRWDLVPAWAFVAWRPNDDWLLRAGRLRLPMYLYSESMDVGQTHDMVRLPTELYSVLPVPDFNGLSVGRSWTLGDQGQRELGIEAFGGATRSTARFWLSEGLAPVVPAGATYWPVKARLAGLAITLRQPDLLVRASLSRSALQRSGNEPFPSNYPWVPLGPGLGYYQVNDSLPGPGVPTVTTVHNTIGSLGAEIGLGQGWRVTVEAVRNVQHDSPFGVDATAGYVAVFKQIHRLTPYVSLSTQRSRQGTRDWYERLTANPLPQAIPGAAQINAAQRLAAEVFWPAEQNALAIGASYRLSPAVKLKGEWLHTRIGQVSHLVDTPAGSAPPRDTGLNVLSLNLSFAF